MENSHSLSVYFGEGCANLYTIGYVSSDIFQLLTFCELLQRDDKRDLEKYFYKGSYRPFNLTRYSRILTDNIEFSDISEVKKGSVELVIAGATLAASIIIPLVAVLLQDHLNQRNQRLVFNINPHDKILAGFVNLYQKGNYGRGSVGLNTFFKELVENNYNIEGITQDVYNINHVTDFYARRIAKTLRMN